MTESQNHPAAEFNIEDWLQDARMPEESVDVYKRADVIGELSALRRQIEVHRQAHAGTERSAGDSNELTDLEQRYSDLVETFASSQLTIFTRAISPDEKRAVRKASDERTKDKTPDEQNSDFGYELLGRSIIAVQPFEGQRTPVSWDHATVRSMENAIGQTQMSAVLKAHQLAQNRLPSVDADFLQKPSGEGAGPES